MIAPDLGTRMDLSIIGLLICALLIAIAWRANVGTLEVAFIASFAFGTTAIATLGFIGGSSPLIYTLFAVLVICATALRRSTFGHLQAFAKETPLLWALGLLLVYAIIGSFILPRLFAGQTTAFVPSRDTKEVFEVPLSPVSHNVTQTAYLVLGILVCIALSATLRNKDRLKAVSSGFFLLCLIQVAFGFVDLAAKQSGLGDPFYFFRSASYALLTDVREQGFFRITGGFSEASAYGAYCVSCFAFSATYWRSTGSSYALVLSIGLGFLLLLSTSSTAYIGAIALSAFFLLTLLRSLYQGKLLRRDAVLLGVAVGAITVIFIISIVRTNAFGDLRNMLDAMVLNKAASASAQERAYWTIRSLQSFVDTSGLGIGVGSSRSSSWLVSVLSQLGVIGTVLMLVIVLELVRSAPTICIRSDDRELRAIHDSVRAFGLIWLIVATVAGGGADPGALLFAVIATVVACRYHLADSSSAQHNLGYLRSH